MNSWRANTFHVLLASVQPIYYGSQICLNLHYSVSLTWLSINAITWLWLITTVTVEYFTSPLRNLPTPANEIFPLGHTRILTEQPPTARVLDVCKNTPNDGLIGIWTLSYLRRHIVPTTPATIMEVLNSRAYDWEKPLPAKKVLTRVLGEGIIVVEGNTHKAMRRVITPAFSGRHIRNLVPLFYTKGIELARSMAREVKSSSDGSAEIMGWMSRVTLDIIGAAGIGKDFKTVDSDGDELAKLYEIITDTNRGPILLFFLINALLPPWLIRRLHGTVYARVANAQVKLRQNIENLLAEKKRNMKTQSVKQNDIISTIIQSGDFSDEYLCNQLLTFLAAGHDTTASALTWTLWLLSKDPKIQDRLREECRAHLSNQAPETIDADILDRMSYLTAVCNETLRLYPTVPVTARQAVVDTTVNNCPVRKGTFLIIAPWAINRLPALWGDDAETYNPDRWLHGPMAATGGAESMHSMLTFLHGPRSCIGQSFAKYEMKSVLAALMMRFRFELVSQDQKVAIGGFITIKPQGGLRLRIIGLEQEKSV